MGKVPKYKKVKAGEVFEVPLVQARGVGVWEIKCCDCGLEHTVVLHPGEKAIQIAVWRRDDLETRHTLPMGQSRGKKK